MGPLQDVALQGERPPGHRGQAEQLLDHLQVDVRGEQLRFALVRDFDDERILVATLRPPVLEDLHPAAPRPLQLEGGERGPAELLGADLIPARGGQPLGEVLFNPPDPDHRHRAVAEVSEQLADAFK